MLLDGFFSAGQGGYYLLVLVFMALLVGLYLWGLSLIHICARTA